jgi:membrane protease subunit HflC
VATRTLLAYKSIITANTTLVLSTDSDLFKFLKGMAPNGQGISDQPSVTTGDMLR